MGVFGKLSFYISIACLTFFVNKQVQAGDGATSRQDDDYHGTTSSQSSQSVTTYNEGEAEAIAFFTSFYQPQTSVTTSSSISEIKFMQKLDHVDSSNDKTWIQTAYVDKQYEKEDGPVVLKVGRFRSIFPGELADPTMTYLGKTLNATLYVLEHRYFGESLPTNYSNDNLEKFCKVEQVLADIAHFIRSSSHASKKWILIGSGCGGTLSAWFRLKYSHLATGALVFGARLRAMTEEQKTFEIFEYLDGNIRLTLNKAIDEIRGAISRAEYEVLKTKFNMCTSLDEGSNINDNVNLMYWSILVYLTDIIVTRKTDLMHILCSESKEAPLDKLARVIDESNGLECFNVKYDDVIMKYKYSKNIQNHADEIDYPEYVKLGLGIRPKFYQRCMQYGYFETSKANENVFGIEINLDFYIKWCGQAFDKNFDLETYSNAINTTNETYGGSDIPATNIIYITSNDTVWKTQGMNKSDSNELITIDFNVINKSFMKHELDVIVGKLNEWTKEKSEGNDSDTRVGSE